MNNMEDNEDFEQFYRDEINHGRGKTMFPDFEKLKTLINVYYFLWDEGFIHEGEFDSATNADEINDAVESEFGIKNYFDENDLVSGIDDMLYEMRNFAESYAR